MATPPEDEPRVDSPDARRVHALAMEMTSALVQPGPGSPPDRGFGSSPSAIAAHLGWVEDVALSRCGRGLDPADVFQEGLLGLMEAVSEQGDATAEGFEEMVRNRIAAQIDRALVEASGHRLQAQVMVGEAETYEGMEAVLGRELGRIPTDLEMAVRMNWPLDRLRAVREIVVEARRVHDLELLPFLSSQDAGDEQEPGSTDDHG
ncbi:MAG: sigma factor [Candidatus Dormibacteraceae bacterium]